MVKILGRNNKNLIIEVTPDEYDDFEDIQSIENPKFKPLDQEGMKQLLEHFSK